MWGKKLQQRTEPVIIYHMRKTISVVNLQHTTQQDVILQQEVIRLGVGKSFKSGILHTL